MSTPPRCRIAPVPCTRALEYVALRWPHAGLDSPSWPRAPGAVQHDARQRAALLHFAPGRWLVPEPCPETLALLQGSACAAAGTLVDVSGKWQALALEGPGARRLLACALEVESVLAERDCAAVTLFDCPAILARRPEGFAVWVQASYAADFALIAERFRTSLEEPS